MPLLFVGIWATGFIVARLVAPHADPLTFLSMRFVLSAAAFTGFAALARAAWPRNMRSWRDALVAGVLMQGIYLSGVFWAARARSAGGNLGADFRAAATTDGAAVRSVAGRACGRAPLGRHRPRALAARCWCCSRNCAGGPAAPSPVRRCSCRCWRAARAWLG